jgi:hypothetical protein
MPRGDKSSYTDKQKRQAEHIEESYKEKGVSEGEAEERAWRTRSTRSRAAARRAAVAGRADPRSRSERGGR